MDHKSQCEFALRVGFRDEVRRREYLSRYSPYRKGVCQPRRQREDSRRDDLSAYYLPESRLFSSQMNSSSSVSG
jgi:hypothetical protein